MMQPIDEPDYSTFSLEELRVVLRNTDRRQFPRHYHCALTEIERRSAQAVSPKQSPQGAWYQWIWEHGSLPRDTSRIVEWWESRRPFWNCYISALVWSAALTSWCIYFGRHVSDNNAREMISFILGSLVATILFGIMTWLMLLILVNVFWCCGWLLDIILQFPLQFLGWNLSVALFVVFLLIAFGGAAYPVVMLLLQT